MFTAIVSGVFKIGAWILWHVCFQITSVKSGFTTVRIMLVIAMDVKCKRSHVTFKVLEVREVIK
jgi:hypothetical protein